ncbi:MAG: thioesterase family protein [Sphingomicrobium sp.]
MSGTKRFGRDAYGAWSSITLRWADNDAYGHVNNTVYYQWFDSAVNGWLVAAGLLDIARGDPIGLVVATACDYFAPLAFPGTIEVGLAVGRLGRSSVAYRLGVFAEGASEPAAQGRFTHVYVCRESRRPIALPTEWRAALEALA